MSARGFVFPPPPPPPPSASTQNYPSYAANPQQNGYGERGNIGGHDPSGRGTGNTRKGQRGNSTGSGGGYSRPGGRLSTTGDGYNTQTNHIAAGGYPLPEYPSVPQSQYIPSVHQGYGYTSSLYSQTVAPSYPVLPAYQPHQQRPQPYYNGVPQSTAFAYQPPAQSAPYHPPEPQDHRAYEHSRRNSNGQPVLMGPPIRLGFDSGYLGGSHRSPTLSQVYPKPSDDTTNRFHHDSQEGFRKLYRHDSPSNYHATRHDSPNPYPAQRNRGQKRGHSDAFSGFKKSNPKSQVAPAVPSFGIPLPTKPPPPQEGGRKRKKKRRHNQLGLTPRTEEHESSEEEDDVDEESKLAAAVGRSTEEQLLQFTYKGCTATLQSPAEISAFIEERKKRFPTKERREEAEKVKREKQETQQAANQARKKALEQQKADFRAKQAAETREAKEKKNKLADEEQAEIERASTVSRAKSKMEKLRRKLEKEEKRIAKAEAKASKAKIRKEKSDRAPSQDHADRRKEEANEGANVNGTNVDEPSQVQVEPSTPAKTEGLHLLQQEDVSNSNIKLEEFPNTIIASEVVEEKIIETQGMAPDPLTPTSQPSIPDGDLVHKSISQPLAISEIPTSTDTHTQTPINNTLPEVDEQADDSSLSTTTITSDASDLSISADSDSENFTSSSGSSSDGDAPKMAPSTRTGPDRVPPPKKDNKRKAICRNFLRGGRCKHGDACTYRHELPERGSQAAKKRKEAKKAEAKTERKGLYQRLVEQEEEKEDQEILAAIVYLGEKGMLQTKTSADNGSGVSVGDEKA